MPRFAVDSASAVDQGVWDHVAEAAGAPPSVWFRYIGGRYAVTPDEVAFLHAQGCAVGLAYNGATGTSVALGREQGLREAAAAISAAEGLGAPTHVVVFADVEASWTPSPDWLRGWAEGQRAGPFAGSGGLYCNPWRPAFVHALAAARAASPAVAAAPLWSAQPEPGPSTAAGAPAWRPAACCGQDVAVWQYAERAFGGIVDLDLVRDGFTGVWEPAGSGRPPSPVRRAGARAHLSAFAAHLAHALRLR